MIDPDKLNDLVREFQDASDLPAKLRMGDEMVRLIGPQLFGLLRQLCGNPDLAEEAYSETLHAIAKGLEKFRGRTGDTFWKWCTAIARHKFKDELRRKKRDRADPMDMDDLAEVVEASAQVVPLSAAVRVDVEYAMNLLRRVSPACYGYLWLHYILDWDWKTTADQLQSTAGAVEKKTRRCLDRARKLLDDGI